MFFSQEEKISKNNLKPIGNKSIIKSFEFQ